MAHSNYGHDPSVSTDRSKASTVNDEIHFYIVRADKTMVPLVPADQLPFKLREVPRQLSYQDIGPGKWIFLKETGEPATPLHIEAPTPLLSGPKFLAPDHQARLESKSKTEVSPEAKVFSPVSRYSTLCLEEPPRSAPLPLRYQSSDEIDECPKSLVDSIASTYPQEAKRYNYVPRLPPSGIAPDSSKKEYCTHWIKTGECAFLSQGCRYKHEIPTLDKLRELGFNMVPKWYKDKTAIKPLSWLREREQARAADRENPVEMPERSIFRDLRKEYEAAEPHSRPPKPVRETYPANGHEQGRIDNRTEGDRAEPVMEDLLIDLGSPISTPAAPQSPSLSIRSVGASSESNSSHSSRPILPSVALDPRQQPTVSTSVKSATDCPIRRYSEILYPSTETNKSTIPPRVKFPTKLEAHHQPRMSPSPTRRVQAATAPKKGGLSSSKHASETFTAYVPHKKGEPGDASVEMQKQITKLRRDRHQCEKRVRRKLSLAGPQVASV
ncbi:hypothetical protein BDV96DRAFT_635278 [Lophiotrema nucula]|uniref:C3H1-type domain-containing protein n=1 Tax=Lophiotrema nucula TaxID=690887 RepID=A0A6A5YU44_9PLEO|nr:hypothetical protein BDV96DRAFT_635278 [Lophiotrema nucula]